METYNKKSVRIFSKHSKIHGPYLRSDHREIIDMHRKNPGTEQIRFLHKYITAVKVSWSEKNTDPCYTYVSADPIIQGYKVSMGHMRQNSKRNLLDCAVDPEPVGSEASGPIRIRIRRKSFRIRFRPDPRWIWDKITPKSWENFFCLFYFFYFTVIKVLGPDWCSA